MDFYGFLTIILRDFHPCRTPRLGADAAVEMPVEYRPDGGAQDEQMTGEMPKRSANISRASKLTEKLSHT